jgi:hypothetical protein
MSEPSTAADREALAALGYDEAWLTEGLLSRALLSEQYARLQAGGTKKTGRYRAQAAAAWTEAAESLRDPQIDAFLTLMREDPDQKMAQSAIAALIGSRRISLEQLERIAQSDAKLMRRHEPLVRRTYLSRRLDEGVTDELLERVLEFADAAIQTKLAKRGANPTIRDNATAWFQDKKAWR